MIILLVTSCSYHRTPITEGKEVNTNGPASDRHLAFPGAQGWAAFTPGGRGGQIIRVTTLERVGPGSFTEAVQAKGPRIVVFEVAGVIDLERENVDITEPYLTIAGQTAPSPGITFIRGGVQIRTHDVIIQHLRVRPGQAGMPKKSGWNVDAITTLGGAHDVIIDHCSVSWATDENLSASGPRFMGESLPQWRQNTSHCITFSNNIIAEGLSNSSHAEGEHSKGTLVHDNVTEILIIGNLYVSNMERNPLFKGGAQGVVANNYIYNPGCRAVHYNLLSEEWRPRACLPGKIVLIGNVLRAGPSTDSDLAFFMFGGSGDLEYFAQDNIAVDRLGRALMETGRYTTTAAEIVRTERKPIWPEGLAPLPAKVLQDSVAKNAGARPWDRDEIDLRLISDVLEAKGSIIDSEEQVGGYPKPSESHKPFRQEEWDLRYMVLLNSSTRTSRN